MDENSSKTYLAVLLQIILVGGVIGAFWQNQWFTGVIVSGILLLTILPNLLAKQLKVKIPAEFQLTIIIFVFASLFLGEIHDYYNKIWWWDIVLHTSSGFLLGIVGFLLVYILNETDQISLHQDTGFNMKPGFVAFFAFSFAVMIGAIWEIFEFVAGNILDHTMERATFANDGSLPDAILDLIVDCVGALVISLLGYRYLKKPSKPSFLLRLIRKFIQINPRLFKRL